MATEIAQAVAAERKRILAAAGELKVTLARPGNGRYDWQEVDVVPLSALRDLLSAEAVPHGAQPDADGTGSAAEGERTPEAPTSGRERLGSLIRKVGAFEVFADEDGELHVMGPCAETLGCLYTPTVGDGGSATIADLILAASAHTGMAAGQAHAAFATSGAFGGDVPENNGRPAVYSSAVAPGGWVCAVPDPGRPDDICGNPVESGPCGEHGEKGRS